MKKTVYLFLIFILSQPFGLSAQELAVPEIDYAEKPAALEKKLSKEEVEALSLDEEISKELQTSRTGNGEEIKKSFERQENITLYSNRKVERFIDMYTGRKREQFDIAIERSAKYLGMIDRIFAQYELPPNLAYLSVVESNFNPKARSHANALGLWQFMRRTGHHFDLSTSWWHDDRYDPEKSTYAAARYLKQLHKELGEWELALAAYNAGSGKVRRTIRKAKRKNQYFDYWSLKLPRETRGYVPGFFAVNILFANLEAYDFNPRPPREAEVAKDFMTVPGGVSLAQVAKVIKVEKQLLASFNPNVPRGVTPADQEYFEIAVPPNTSFDADRIKNLEKSRKRFWKHHRVRRGDTLWSISRRYGVPISQIVAFNRLNRKRVLRIRQKIMLPVSADYSYRAIKHKNKKSSKKKGYTYHRVKAGESFWSISKSYNIPIRKIKGWNRTLARRRFLKAGNLVALKL
ncbi:MAG: transglycosylase SLT domain-containing protein [SAR324 cluster bacterium]|nr:transglycosylase SLT domain-containing protein [SAR324 cluster bacterium]